MQEWVWEARTRTGEVRKGIMEAANEAAVQDRLKTQNLTPTRVRKKPREVSLQFGAPVSEKELVVFIRQFATMIDAGLPLVQCLDILSAQGDNKAFNRILKDVKANVEQGATFSDSLRRHPKVFDELFVNLVQAGEVGGILDTILGRLAVYIEKRVKLKRQVRSALVYPSAVMVIAGVVLTVLLTWVIPSFQSMFADFGDDGDLPGPTQLVINMSEFFVGNFVFIFAGLFAIGAGISYSYRTPGGKRFWHRFLLEVPVLGPVMRKIAVSRFTRTLGTLLASGVPILEALDIVAKASGNVIVEAAIKNTSDRIREGRTMAEPLMETKVFPPMVVQMIGVGEQTGALDQMLNKIADFYEEEVDVAVAALTSLLEPIMMVVIGGMVGFMLIAMYMPIFDIAGKVQGH
ncbi:type II secretion system F family protein [Sandaracinus amylolyticus]|uniref:type II secretion system F family protein n=1 Tax=Sandaracinus amylolyticus TaxID=927083 RepID=UPI001F189F06|nr:type II secretion system F family protein [Sandaracinus amylolyticus]UJR80278.1 Type IV pilus inner membrane protein PilC [Sandaracinus amylolyticus]